MNYKVMLFLFVITFLNISFASIKACFVSSDISNLLPSAKDFDKRLGGYTVAIDLFLANENLKTDQISLLDYTKTNSKGFIPDGIKWAKENKCNVVVGLITSRDALVAGPFLREEKLKAFSSTATNSTISQYYPFILSLSTTTDSYLEALVSSAHISKKIVAIYKEENVYSLHFYEALKLKKQDVKFIKMKSDNTVDLSEIPYGATVLITTYPLESIPVVKQLSTSDKVSSLTIIGTQSWMETHAFKSQNIDFEKFKKVQVFSPWDFEKPNKIFSHFSQKYLNKYGTSPDHDSIYDFDVMTIILHCALDKRKRILDSDLLNKCMSMPITFTGASGGHSFNGTSSHTKRKEYLLDYMKLMEMF